MPKSVDNHDEFGDNEGEDNLFELHSGIVKVKVTGNNKLYCHIGHTNLGSATKRLEKGKIIGLLSLADIVDDSTLSLLCIERLFSDPTSNVNTISNESNPINDSIPAASNSPPTELQKVDYSIPENRW